MERYACACNVNMDDFRVTNHILIRFEAFSKGKSLLLKISPRRMIILLIGPIVNVLPIFSEMDIESNCPLNTCLFSCLTYLEKVHSVVDSG